jgi:hypothetical protein
MHAAQVEYAQICTGRDEVCVSGFGARGKEGRKEGTNLRKEGRDGRREGPWKMVPVMKGWSIQSLMELHVHE